MYKKIIVIGDIRGDSRVLIKSLELANLIKENVWIGKDTYVIQMGNTLSSKSSISPPLSKEYLEISDEIKIFNLINIFDSKARLHSCRVVSILGKHELLTYYHGNDPIFMKQYVKNKDEKLYKKMYNCSRNTFWKPGNEGGKILSKRPLFYLSDKILFTNFNLSVHSDASEDEINKNNKDVEYWLQSGKNKPDIISKYFNDVDTKLNPKLLNLHFEKIITSNSFHDCETINVTRVKSNSSRAFGENTNVEILEIITQPNVIIRRVSEETCTIEP
jgi:hypothetical protein